MSDHLVMRHGHTLPAGVDRRRGLSARGRRETAEVAARLAGAGLRFDLVLHSGRRRARETAEILARAAADGAPIEEREDLAPGGDPGATAALLATAAGNVAIVGHLPHVELLVSLLAEPENMVEMGTACALHLRAQANRWRITGRFAPRS